MSIIVDAVLFFNELEDVLEILTNDQVQPIDTLGPYLFAHLAKCMGSAHFQVGIERACIAWVGSGVLVYACSWCVFCE